MRNLEEASCVVFARPPGHNRRLRCLQWFPTLNDRKHLFMSVGPKLAWDFFLFFNSLRSWCIPYSLFITLLLLCSGDFNQAGFSIIYSHPQATDFKSSECSFLLIEERLPGIKPSQNTLPAWWPLCPSEDKWCVVHFCKNSRSSQWAVVCTARLFWSFISHLLPAWITFNLVCPVPCLACNHWTRFCSRKYPHVGPFRKVHVLYQCAVPRQNMFFM